MVADPKTLPANIREFNEIVGAIFAQLYRSFPVSEDIHPSAISLVLGYSTDEKLESGRTFNELMAYTAAWLALEGFTHPSGAHPRERVVLTTKALAAMNAIPDRLGGTLGSQIANAAQRGSREGKLKLAELAGTFFGYFIGSGTKSIAGG